ncbi:hypothetical protein VIGAN_06066900 [Vigna angularis var. angularis]|uniref:Uncharacterized protein n=1 Tax=Vigna angularis var. angularis TaxID=157739 RepID=A0A0S3S9V5_PHAAN|nr:hypothetical protein VIGAN_06066900 [Vigna angularis var. angularis]
MQVYKIHSYTPPTRSCQEPLLVCAFYTMLLAPASLPALVSVPGMRIIFSLALVMLLSIGVANEGTVKVAEGKLCDVQLYNYCDEDCYSDCPKLYGARALGMCNPDSLVCICRRLC